MFKHALFTTTLLAVCSTSTAQPQLQLGNTTLVGRSIPTLGQEFYGGIRFAEPPVGNLRFAPPVAASLNASTLDAANYGPACPQPALPLNVTSEDCLTVNVLRPAGIPSNSSLPVMVWVYGGGFTEGTSSTYNGSAIVLQSMLRGTPVIYVNFNYRLGPLGFPQGNEVASTNSTNLGLKDQLAALKWVQKNIRAFGGDPKAVTVFGESAGSISIAILFLNSQIEKLARAAIFESGSAATTLTFNATKRDNDWKAYVSAVPSCASLASSGNTLSCLRNASSSDLFQAAQVASGQADEVFPWVPVIDGPNGLMPRLPSELWKSGHFSRLPFITGTNLDEGTFVTPTQVNYTTDLIRQLIVANFTPSLTGQESLEKAADRILQLYPEDPALGSPFNTGNETFGLSPQYKRAAAINGDISFQSQRRAWIQAASRYGVKTYGYLFTDRSQSANPALGVYHGSEVLYVFGGLTNATASTTSLRLSANMVDYWISFATSLDPNDGKGTQRSKWSQYTSKNQSILQLNGTNTTMIPDNYRSAQIQYINDNPVVFHHKRAAPVVL